jgi:arylsulfatase A-like enzyme
MFPKPKSWPMLCWLALAGCSSDAPPKAVPKNLLFVIFDTTRADHLGTYGYEKYSTSPRLDALAKEGLVLERAYAHSSLTPVSAGSFLTGTLPQRHGVRSLFNVGEESLKQDTPSLFGMLRESGRQTAGFVSAKPMGKHYGLDRGFDSYEDDLDRTRASYAIQRFSDAPQRPGDVTTDLALEWLGAHSQEPFAMLVHLFDAHDLSFVPPPSFLKDHLSFPMPAEIERRGDSFRPQSLEQLVELYDAEIRYTDLQLGRLLDKLTELGVEENTLVVVLADHGEAFGEHGYFTHGWLTEEQLRVPLVLRGPGIAAGVRIPSRVGLVDLLPSLAQAFDLPSPAGLAGQSFLELAAGATAEDRDIYAEVHHAPGDPRGREPEMYTMIVGDWKYIHHPTSGAHELYALGSDPGEENNQFSKQPAVAARLLERLLRCGALGGAGVNLEGLSEQQVRELQALGYLGSVDEKPNK